MVTRKGLRGLNEADAAVARHLAALADRLPPAKRRRAVEGLELWSEAMAAARAAQRAET
jgi:hypothetical protein